MTRKTTSNGTTTDHRRAEHEPSSLETGRRRERLPDGEVAADAQAADGVARTLVAGGEAELGGGRQQRSLA